MLTRAIRAGNDPVAAAMSLSSLRRSCPSPKERSSRSTASRRRRDAGGLQSARLIERMTALAIVLN
jgi:hypothetical protein